MQSKYLVSIILPVYNEEQGLVYFHNSLLEVLPSLHEHYDFELIYVNDGSSDRSQELLESLEERGHKLMVVALSRNFGHQAAISCGIDYCEGDAAITMDTDGQHPPESISDFIVRWEAGNDIVFSLREDADNTPFLKSWCSALFYKVFNIISNQKIHPGASDFRLISRKVIRIFQNDIRERNRFLRGLNSWVGFKSAVIEYKAVDRLEGESKYSNKKMLSLASSGFVSFSHFPLKLGLYLGGFFFLISCSYLIGSLVYGYFNDTLVRGWTSLIVVIIMFSSIQFLFIGILGLYIRDILDEVKARPLYIVDEVSVSKEV